MSFSHDTVTESGEGGCSISELVGLRGSLRVILTKCVLIMTVMKQENKTKSKSKSNKPCVGLVQPHL